MNVSRATFYRRRDPDRQAAPRPAPARALSPQERQEVLDQLNSERFADHAPRQVYAKLLDEGDYLCSVRTMYRILADNQSTRERRNQLKHPEYRKPELLATAPNEVWSWDITKLKGPETWTYYYLYVILDIYSRCVVGWMLADSESADLAKQLIETTIDKQNIPPEQLIIHSDRGPSMTSHSVAQLLSSLGVTKSHSRPHVSNDNPFSESQFKTMKYRPEFPKRFGCYEDGLQFCRTFFTWYNNEHYHSGIGLLTPSSLHFGRAEEVTAARTQTLHGAWKKTPERFVHGIPKPASVPKAVWINPPKPIDERKREAPEPTCPGASEETSLTHPRSDYPLDGCVPAEPSSVSPDESTLPPKTPLNTRAMPEKIPGVRGLAPKCAGINH
ncbi:Integrase core domain protein [Rubripirellula lacrimiformis]|uniref:Integrase core domain protein n=1 Tax=Rubripirellula lacrimiformis TaxID=1930273 RepID=A0A517NBH0_9BACT|nr:Integrase core domain protein [Rubripirellula lacrimiformis]QDT06919.1 Integrase core domain protein [Rubripirellula lacrimiformis]